MLPVIILAGGMATRLYPVTRNVPKAMIHICGRPFIDHQLRLLQEKGISEVILCIGNLGSNIEEFVGDGARWGLSVRYSYDGTTLLGTGGAVKKAAGLLDGAFFIMYGDSYLDIDYQSVAMHFLSSGFPVLMTVFRNRNSMDVSNILMINGRIAKYSKTECDPSMEYIDYGLIAMRKEILDGYPSGTPFDLSGVLSEAVAKEAVIPFEVKQRFFEIGSFQGILETEDYIRNRTPRS